LLTKLENTFAIKISTHTIINAISNFKKNTQIVSHDQIHEKNVSDVVDQELLANCSQESCAAMQYTYR
jgi:hypothetical protein